MILAADKISKVRELRLASVWMRRSPARASCAQDRWLAHYRECLQLLEERLPDSPLVGRLCAELGNERAAGHHTATLTGTDRQMLISLGLGDARPRAAR
jgi:hypothetical protein